MTTLTMKEFQVQMKNQGGRVENVLFKCPKCGTLQSMADLMKEIKGSSTDDVRRFVAFSCIGRFTKKKGCNSTLASGNGLHKVSVIDEAGEKHPRFEVATVEEAESHRRIQ
jgi:hypothetical protein